MKVLFFFNFFRTLNEQLPCSPKNVSAGISKLKIAVFVSKDESKNQIFENSLFFSTSSEFCTNNYRAWQKGFRQGYQNWKLQSSSHKINQKIKFLKVLFFFQILQNFERTFTVLGENFLDRDIKIELCTLCLQGIILRIKIFFWKFCKFSFTSDLEHKILDLWQHRFTRFVEIAFQVYIWILFEMLVLEVTYVEEKLFLNLGGKNSTCFLKLHSTCPKEHFE